MLNNIVGYLAYIQGTYIQGGGVIFGMRCALYSENQRFTAGMNPA